MPASHIHDPRALADEVFEAGLDSDAVDRITVELGARAPIFLRRLATRVALAGTPDSLHEMGMPDSDAVAQAITERLVAAYLRDVVGSSTPTVVKDLSRPQTWAAATAALGGDISFVTKLAGRLVSEPTISFLRDAADALGIAVARVRDHFAAGLPRGFAGAEHKSSGKPRTGGVEDFASAVAAADIPAELKSRWLSN